MDIHPAAEVYPKMGADELALLAADIKANGQQEKIKLLEGKILDGRNRWDACQLAGVAPRSEDIATFEPLATAHSYNRSRRHLTPSQRAMVAANELEYLKKHPGEKGLNYNRVVHEQQISERSVARAQRVKAKGTKKLRKKVEKGEISVREADSIAGHTPEQQDAIIEQRDVIKNPPRKPHKKAEKPRRQAPMKEAKESLRKEARVAFASLVRHINKLGMFEELFNELERIRSRIEG